MRNNPEGSISGIEPVTEIDNGLAGAGISAALFAPIAPPTAFEETVERLGSAIRLGILPPGGRLPAERDLAEAFAISRTTLRQAIAALVQAGLLKTRRGRSGGTWVVSDVPPLTPADVVPGSDWNEMLDLRLAIETGSAFLFARRGGKEILDQMEQTHKELNGVLSKDLEFMEYRRLDVRFHLLLAEGSGSTRLVAQMAEAQDAMSRLTGSKPWPTIALKRSNSQHRKLLKALRAKDGGKAAETLFEHIEGSRLIIKGMGIA